MHMSVLQYLRRTPYNNVLYTGASTFTNSHVAINFQSPLDPFLRLGREARHEVEQDDRDHQRATWLQRPFAIDICDRLLKFEITLYTSRMYLQLARYCSTKTPMFPPAGCFYASGFPAQATRPKLAVMALEYTARRPKTRLLSP